MKANVLFGVNDLRYITYDRPILKKGQVLVEVKAAGICGSDVARVFKNGTYHFPTIIGHEVSGVVKEVKDEKDVPLVNRRVSVYPLIPCGECPSCRQGFYETCTHYNYLGSRCDGGFAQYVAVPTWNILTIPDEITFEQAAMLEPCAVAIHALRKARIGLGSKVAIFGPGTIGMILCRMAKLTGAHVLLLGRTQQKLDHAEELELVDEICNVTMHNAHDWILEQTDSQGVDVAIEGTGSSEMFGSCLQVVKAGGTVVCLGNPQGDYYIEKNNYWQILRKQFTLLGTWNSSFAVPGYDWKRVLDLMSDQLLHPERLITHRFPLSQLNKGLDLMRDQNVYTNKVMIINE